MPVDVSLIFKAESTSASNLLCHGSTGFYVPAYQRPYSWSEEHIRRLFEDIAHGLRLSLLEKSEAITFIGSIILIADQTKQTINPVVQGQTPNVNLVIDGQQRLTTLLLMCVELHRSLMKCRKQDVKNAADDDKAAQWLLVGLLLV